MHIQYIDWPDHGIPEDPQPFISKSFTYMYINVDNNQICAIHVIQIHTLIISK